MVTMPVFVKENRKGIGYTLEAISAILLLFIFALGNTPPEPSQDWTEYRKTIAANDLGHVLQSTGDMENFVKRSNTGSLQTAVSTLSSDRLKVSGNVNGLPIERTSIGFNRSNGVKTIGLQSVTSCSGDLEEIESQAEILETSSTEDGVKLYLGDTDPEVAGGNDGTVGDYDSLWADNGTTCQFSSAEGPFYKDSIFGWADGGFRNHYDFKNVTASNELILHRANTTKEISGELRKDLNGVRTSHQIDTFRYGNEDLTDYDIIVLSREGSLDYADQNFAEIRNFINQGGSLVLLSDLESYHFDASDPDSSKLIVESGLEWIDMSANPSSSSEFTTTRTSREVETYFEGLDANSNTLSLSTGGKVSSSNQETLIDSDRILVSGNAEYELTEWNATNYSMEQRSPENFEGVPDTECINDETAETESFTYGELKFPEYNETGKRTYDVINTELGSSSSYCNTEDVRAINIDLNGNSRYNDPGEGPFLNGEMAKVEKKSYRIVFPDTAAMRSGEAVELAYEASPEVEVVNHRTSFRDFKGEMIRMSFEENYNSDEEKLVSSLIYWLQDDSKSFGSTASTSISTKVIGSTRKNTYLPYKASLRWR